MSPQPAMKIDAAIFTVKAAETVGLTQVTIASIAIPDPITYDDCVSSTSCERRAVSTADNISEVAQNAFLQHRVATSVAATLQNLST